MSSSGDIVLVPKKAGEQPCFSLISRDEKFFVRENAQTDAKEFGPFKRYPNSQKTGFCYPEIRNEKGETLFSLLIAEPTHSVRMFYSKSKNVHEFEDFVFTFPYVNNVRKVGGKKKKEVESDQLVEKMENVSVTADSSGASNTPAVQPSNDASKKAPKESVPREGRDPKPKTSGNRSRTRSRSRSRSSERKLSSGANAFGKTTLVTCVTYGLKPRAKK